MWIPASLLSLPMEKWILRALFEGVKPMWLPLLPSVCPVCVVSPLRFWGQPQCPIIYTGTLSPAATNQSPSRQVRGLSSSFWCPLTCGKGSVFPGFCLL